MDKRWLTHQGYDRPESHLEYFLKIQHVHAQKMIDTTMGMTYQDLI